MEFRIVAGGPWAASHGKSTYLPEKALAILEANPAMLAENVETGERYGLADLKRLLDEQTKRNA